MSAATLAHFWSVSILAANNPSDIIGTIKQAPKSLLTEEPGSAETVLGDVAANAVRSAAGTDIALINSGDLTTDLNKGEVSWNDVLRVFADNRRLGIIIVTPAELTAILETSVSHVMVDLSTESIDRAMSDYDGFCQVSGLSFRYDASAPVGERIMAVTLSDGTSLDLDDNETKLSLAATAYMLEGGYGYEPRAGYEALSICLADALAGYISEHDPLLPEDSGERIIALGTRDRTIIGSISPPLIVVGCLVFAAVALLVRMKLRQD